MFLEILKSVKLCLNLLLTFVALSICPSLASANTGLILNPANDWPSFGETAKLLVPILSKQGVLTKYHAFNDDPKPFNLLMTNGTFTQYQFKMFDGMPPVQSPLNYFKQSIADLASDSSQSNILIFLTHGGVDQKNPRKPGQQDPGIYVTSKERLYFSDVAAIIKEKKAAQKKFRYVAGTCYGNAAHQIALLNENTCGLGYSDAEVFYPSGVPEANMINIFTDLSGRSDDLDKSGGFGLLDQYLMLATKNIGILSGQEIKQGDKVKPTKLGSMSLSSMHYAELILGRINHHSKFTPNFDTGLTGLIRNVQSAIFFCDEIDEQQEPDILPSELSILRVAKGRKRTGSLTDLTCRDRMESELGLNGSDNVVQFKGIITDLNLNSDRYLIGVSSSEIAVLPKEFQTAYATVLSHLRPQIVTSSSQFLKFIEKNQKLIESYILMSDQYANCSSQCNRPQLQVLLLKANLEIRSKIMEAIDQITFYKNEYEILMRFKVLAQAFMRATTLQKQKLKSLMMCEIQKY